MLRQLRLIPLLDALIQRLQNSNVNRGDYVHCGVQLFLRHPRFPCVRKATVDSRIAEPHHRDGKTDQHLLAFSKTLDPVSLESDTSANAAARFSRSPLGPLVRRPYAKLLL